MSKEYDNTNRGQLWKNNKRDSDKHPHFTGTLNVEGVEYYVSAWKKRDDAPEKAPLLTFTVKPKENPDAEPVKKPSAKPIPTVDEDLPF